MQKVLFSQCWHELDHGRLHSVLGGSVHWNTGLEAADRDMRAESVAGQSSRGEVSTQLVPHLAGQQPRRYRSQEASAGLVRACTYVRRAAWFAIQCLHPTHRLVW
jgi:hypothetical protein